MRSELKNWLVMIVIIALVTYAMLGRLAHGGADIPIDPRYIILNASRITRVNNCLPTWTAQKVYRCDRISFGNFEG